IFATGRDAQRPRKLGTLTEPFAFVDGDTFQITVTAGGQTITRTVTLHLEHFQTIATATASEIAALLNREIPGVEVTADQDGKVLIEAVASGSTTSLNLLASPVATKLGLATGVTSGTDATSAQLSSRLVPTFTL